MYETDRRLQPHGYAEMEVRKTRRPSSSQCEQSRVIRSRDDVALEAALTTRRPHLRKDGPANGQRRVNPVVLLFSLNDSYMPSEGRGRTNLLTENPSGARAPSSQSCPSVTQFAFRFHGLCGHANEESLPSSAPRVYRAVHVTLRREGRKSMQRVRGEGCEAPNHATSFANDTEQFSWTGPSSDWQV